MKLAVDSNILFTYFWKNSIFEEITLRADMQLFSPEYALTEITKYKNEIKKKAKITEQEFTKKKEALRQKVTFVPLSGYSDQFRTINTPDMKDIDFVALAQKLICPLWTNDQKLIEINGNTITTEELIELLG